MSTMRVGKRRMRQNQEPQDKQFNPNRKVMRLTHKRLKPKSTRNRDKQQRKRNRFLESSDGRISMTIRFSLGLVFEERFSKIAI
jgi:hypothetical protein